MLKFETGSNPGKENSRMTKLKVLLKKKGFTYKELGERTGINYKTIASYAVNHRPIDMVPIKQLAKISIVLHCPIADLLEDEETVELLKKTRMSD